MRLAILRAKADSLGVSVPNDVTSFIAERVQRNVRELTGALNRVMAQAEVMGMAPSLDLAQMVLQDLAPQANVLSPVMVLELVAVEYGLSADDLSRRGRSKEVVLPRQVAMYLLREVTQLSLPQIGEIVGGRDHTTIMHGINKIAALAESDASLRRQLLALKERIYAPSPSAVVPPRR
jgi:chromosomal replication initiator protein